MDGSCCFVDIPGTTPSSRHELATGTGSRDVPRLITSTLVLMSRSMEKVCEPSTTSRLPECKEMKPNEHHHGVIMIMNIG